MSTADQWPHRQPSREHPLWRLTKGARATEACARQVPVGTELRISVDGELFWSRVYRDGDGQLLGEKADETSKRRAGRDDRTRMDPANDSRRRRRVPRARSAR
jgi:hypothetical protein